MRVAGHAATPDSASQSQVLPRRSGRDLLSDRATWRITPDLPEHSARGEVEEECRATQAPQPKTELPTLRNKFLQTVRQLQGDKGRVSGHQW